MHRAPGLRSRPTTLMFMFVVPLAVLAVLGLLFGRSLLGPSSRSALASVALNPTPVGPATAPPTSPGSPGSPVPSSSPTPGLWNLGVIKGNYTVKGPRSTPAGSAVIVVLDGPKRLVRTDAKAPFAVTVNTRTLPNGTYTVTVLTLHQGRKSVVSTATVRISNPKAKPTPPTPTKAPAPTPTGSGGGVGSGGGTNTGYAAQVLSLTNAQRASAGCKPLHYNADLANAAQGHSADMAKNNYFDHNSQDGTNPFTRMTRAGYKWSAAAENIAMGQSTPAAVMTAWMNSPGHKANILNCTYTDLGVGYAKNASGAAYWTQDFGKPL